MCCIGKANSLSDNDKEEADPKATNDESVSSNNQTDLDMNPDATDPRDEMNEECKDNTMTETSATETQLSNELNTKTSKDIQTSPSTTNKTTTQRKRGRKPGSRVIDGHVIQKSDMKSSQLTESISMNSISSIQDASDKDESMMSEGRFEDGTVLELMKEESQIDENKDIDDETSLNQRKKARMMSMSEKDENQSMDMMSTSSNGDNPSNDNKDTQSTNSNNISKKLSDIFDATIKSEGNLRAGDERDEAIDISESNDRSTPAIGSNNASGDTATSSIRTRNISQNVSISNALTGRGSGRGQGSRGGRVGNTVGRPIGSRTKGNVSMNNDQNPSQRSNLSSSTKKHKHGSNTHEKSNEMNSYPALQYHTTKGRSLLGNIAGFGTGTHRPGNIDSDLYRAFHSIRYVVELMQYASSDRTDYARLLNCNVSLPLPSAVVKIPTPSKQVNAYNHISYALDALTKDILSHGQNHETNKVSERGGGGQN